MNRDEQGLIQNLFGKLSEAERTAPPRDPEAEGFIRESVERQPGAPYYMAQTIIIQEQALEAAQARIQALEAEVSQPRSGGGGFFGSLFGGGASAARPAPRPTHASAAYGQPSQPGPYGQPARGAGPWNGGAQAGHVPQGGRMGGGGGGFLAGAAQTAMGVAGGMMLGSMLSNAFSDPAAAAEGAVADAGDAAETELASATEDMGGEDFGGFDEV
ncbi:hypothetical protein ASG43_16950 [Aureimonas sp. Leaf454]|uniref:DUF2076 domain-containing protein n=1 Tax=Aureimonas sp. Leaf454 TaxID=1736381 RepID=UPI0006FEB635|nr:DUF2076 domain-containing protein [Aureimonas sp. Leaf454]KQT41974.1 hypothetical protein ASG43_16950 [Aureimonas sp. Leaf454]